MGGGGECEVLFARLHNYEKTNRFQCPLLNIFILIPCHLQMIATFPLILKFDDIYLEVQKQKHFSTEKKCQRQMH